MKIGDLCSRDVHVVRPGDPLAQAVQEMHHRRIGAVVVVEVRDAHLVPVGIVTDRDVLCRQLARQADLFTLTVSDVMTQHPLTVLESCDVAETIRQMRAGRVRRAPVVSRTGALVGLISLDDLLPAVAGELSDLASLLGSQARWELPIRAGAARSVSR